MVIFVVVLVVIVLIVQKMSLANPLAGLQYSARASKGAVEPDESFDVITVLENRRRMPIFFMNIQEYFPPEIDLDLAGVNAAKMEYHYLGKGNTGPFKLETILQSRAYLMPRQRMTRRVKATLPRRGRYFFHGCGIYSGDFLGIKDTFEEFFQTSEIVVYPRKCDLPEDMISFGGILGDRSVRRFIMEDPVLTLGFREYTGREPQKAISWIQSLRAGQLMVKKYDYTLEPTASVILNLEGGDEEQQERAFELARAVCELLERKKIKYSFLTNAPCSAAFGRWSYISDGLGSRHIETILEGLGRSVLNTTQSFASLLTRAAASAETGRTHIVVTSGDEHACPREVARLYAVSGQRPVVVCAERGVESCR